MQRVILRNTLTISLRGAREQARIHHHHHRAAFSSLSSTSSPWWKQRPSSSTGCQDALVLLPARSVSSQPPVATTQRQQPHHYQQERRDITTTSFVLPDPTEVSGGASGSGRKGTNNQVRHLPLVKMVATIGPTSEQAAPLQQVVQAGMRIMRLNFSHATPEEVELRCRNLAAAQEALAREGVTEPQDTRAILLDTKGPEIRTGKLQNDASGHETVTLEQGARITLHTDIQHQEEGSTATDLFIDYPTLHKAVSVGSKVLLDDGSIALVVEEVETHKAYHGKVHCRIENTGYLRSRAGVNLPLADTSDLPAMSDKDKADIQYGMAVADIDYVAASFVQTADAVREIRRHIQQCAAALKWDAAQPLPKIISKIETASALQNFDEILRLSDGIMVARGDLGVEIPLQQVTNAQKEMIAACNAAGKPCIVATQMLESMSKNPRPTRAEVSDVTNAVYDGADAVMCSGETAKGKYPAQTVRMMNEIVYAAEQYAKQATWPVSAADRRMFQPTVNTADTAVAKAAVTAATERSCVAILVLSNYGTLPAIVAAFRPSIPVLAFCPSPKMGRQLQLHRGVYPIVGLQGISSAKRPETAVQTAVQLGYIRTGDPVVVVSMEEEKNLGRTATMKIVTVP